MRIKCFVSFLWLAAILAGAAVNLAAAETSGPSPSKSYLLAYESMSTADWLLKRGMNEDAAALYDESLKLFLGLASEYPTWQTNLVAFRINYCREGFAKARRSKKAEVDQRDAVSPEVKPPLTSGPAQPVTTAPEPAGGDTDIAGKIAQALRLEQAADFQSAGRFYEAVLDRENQNPAALAGAGRCLLRLGMLDKARDLLFQWSVIPSPDKNINMLLALILCHDGQFAKAIQLAEIAVNDDLSNAAAHVILGVALAGMGQTNPALGEMQKALALNPRLNEAHYNLARMLLAKDPKNKTTAREYYLNALKFGAAPDPELAKQLKK